MPMLIQYIDEIAREKQRDVLYIKFVPENCGIHDSMITWLKHDYRHQSRRAEVLSWLDTHDIPWQMCGWVADENIIECPYFGDVYIDIPFDENDPQYQIVRDYLENSDGTMRDEHVYFCYLPLAKAMENAHHDEPGFWENIL
jgi:hypothetical protein